MEGKGSFGEGRGGGGGSLGRVIPGFGSAVSLVRKRDHFGKTPLHLACSTGNLGVVAALPEIDDADLAAPDDAGWTPLHRAVFGGCGAVADLLLECGVKDDDVTAEGYAPFSLTATTEMKVSTPIAGNSVPSTVIGIATPPGILRKYPINSWITGVLHHHTWIERNLFEVNGVIGASLFPQSRDDDLFQHR